MASKTRPSPLSAKSFSRYEPPASPAPSNRSRASTIGSPVDTRKSQDEERHDVFTKKKQDDETESPRLDKTKSLPDHFDELPIELASLTDRFVESLATKAFAEPPTIDQIAELFQEFYTRATSSISIHIASLRSKLNRESSPSSAKGGTRPRQVSGKKSNDSLAPSNNDGSQQMLTASEVAEKRKQRKLLDYKKLVLEEAVERRACEKVYDKIWRHKSTLDEVEDEKLRSKTAALALVGIGLRDLGIELGEEPGKTAEDVQEALAPARIGLMKMNDEHYPLGKLQHLTEAHKVIVDTLFSVHGSSSSADEILPTLIYTLISAPAEGINVISNLYFIQRFRASLRMDGEAAYCLTNLEAAIGFLQEVDLASLRSDELPEGPRKASSGYATPTVEKTEPFPGLLTATETPSILLSAEPVSATDQSTTPKDTSVKALAAMRPPPSPRHQRTLSELLKPVHNANEAVRATAREGLDNISNTLDNSLKFVFGRLKEHASGLGRTDDLTVPKTLDEARQLVSKPTTPILGDDGAVISENSSVAGDPITESPDGMEREKTKIPNDDKLLGLFGNRKSASGTARDQSVDRESLRSNSSAKKVAFAGGSSSTDAPAAKPVVVSSAPNTGNPLDAMKSFGGSLNPLGHVGNAFNAFGGTFKGFGRPATTPPPQQPAANTKKENARPLAKSVLSNDPSIVNDDGPKIAVFLDKPEKIASKIKSVPPPIQKFLNLGSADDLQLKDIPKLLADYQRLAALLNNLASLDPESPDDFK